MTIIYSVHVELIQSVTKDVATVVHVKRNMHLHSTYRVYSHFTAYAQVG